MQVPGRCASADSSGKSVPHLIRPFQNEIMLSKRNADLAENTAIRQQSCGIAICSLEGRIRWREAVGDGHSESAHREPCHEPLLVLLTRRPPSSLRCRRRERLQPEHLAYGAARANGSRHRHRLTCRCEAAVFDRTHLSSTSGLPQVARCRQGLKKSVRGVEKSKGRKPNWKSYVREQGSPT